MRWLLVFLLTTVALAESPRVLTVDDHSKNIPVKVGEKLAVRLPTNPSSGYAWELIYKNSQLRRVGKPVYKPTNAKKPKLGGSVTWTFEVSGDFDDNLELSYIQPMVKKPKPLRTFSVHLRTSSEDS